MRQQPGRVQIVCRRNPEDRPALVDPCQQARNETGRRCAALPCQATCADFMQLAEWQTPAQAGIHGWVVEWQQPGGGKGWLQPLFQRLEMRRKRDGPVSLRREWGGFGQSDAGQGLHG